MSRPDWGALQQEYIAEYTRSGISPVAWCEANRRALRRCTLCRFPEHRKRPGTYVYRPSEGYYQYAGTGN